MEMTKFKQRSPGITTMLQNIERIRQIAEWFPGVTLGLQRQSGKTTAIMEMIHDLGGEAVYFGMTEMMVDRVKNLYRETYPNDVQPLCTDRLDDLRGRKVVPVFVDEPWMIKREVLNYLSMHFPVVIKIGTEF